LLSQNRQYQVFSEKTVIYPIVPAQAATLLKQAGHKVIWNDCIAQGLTYKEFLDFIQREKPDLIAFETKTPVVKQHWKIINDIKGLSPKGTVPKIVLFGDHVTALPEESFQNSQVDFVLTGGDYDFLLLNLCNYLDMKGLSPSGLKQSSLKGTVPYPEELEPGIYYRQNGSIKNTGKFKLSHDLNSLPFIDRDLTKWQLYAYKNGNYKRTPGTYIMSGRDCWWGKCTFCLHPDTHILTSNGQISIAKLAENELHHKNNLLVLTHNATFEPVNKTFKRYYEGEMLNLEFYELKQNLKITPNHKIYVLRRNLIKRCSKRCSWDYLCVPGRKSIRLDCFSCKKKYYKHYSLEFIPASELEDGDFVAVPIIRGIRDLDNLDILQIYKDQPLFIKTTKLKEDSLINDILNKHNLGFSQRMIAKELQVHRRTVKRYLSLLKNNELEAKQNPIIEKGGYIKFEKGKKWINRTIPVSREFMRLVGYYLAEGHITKIKDRPNSYALILTFSKREKEFIDDVVGIAKSIFSTLDIRTHANRKNNTVHIAINSAILAKVFYNLFGSNSYNKKFPESFLYLSLEKQKELLKGLFRGDGHLRIRNRNKGGTEYIFETVSPLMANQVLMLLFRNEKIPRFRICSPGKKATVPTYSLSLSQYDIEELFPEIILPKRRSKYRHGFILNNFAMIPIKRILKERYNGFVYNLEVDQYHSYLANNIIVSNCSWPTLYPEFRVRSTENVLDEIGALISRYKIREVMDDTGSFPTGEWLRNFCNGMIKRGFNKRIYLDCNMRFGALSYEEFSLMKKANFRLLLFGLESANQKTLDKINKNLKVERIIEDCKSVTKAGLFPHITIMFGYPWEDYNDALNTLKLGRWLLKKGYAYTMQATVVIPYPGSQLFEECKRNGWLKTLDWQDYDMKQPLMQTQIPDEKLMALVQGMYKVSFRPEFIFRRIFSVRDPDDLKYSLRAAKKVMGHIFDFKKGLSPKGTDPKQS